MVSSWIRDKVVSAVEADVAEHGGDAQEVIWQLSKDLKKMVRFGEPLPPEVIASIDAVDPMIATMSAERTAPVAKMLANSQVSQKLVDASNYLKGHTPPIDLRGLSDYELAELQVNLRVERQRRIDIRHESPKS